MMMFNGKRKGLLSVCAAALILSMLAPVQALGGPAYQAGSGSASGEFSTAVGGGGTIYATGYASTAIGTDANAGGSWSAAFGANAAGTVTGSLALGGYSNATGSNSVALGSGSVASADNVVSVGGGRMMGSTTTPATRKIVNVSDGVADSDAATIKNVKDKVAAAKTELNTAITNTKNALNTSINSVSSDLNTLNALAVKYSGAGGNVVQFGTTSPINMTVDGTGGVLTFAKSGVGGGDVKLSGIADGTAANDAATVGQLSGMKTDIETSIASINTSITNIDGSITDLEYKTENITREGDKTKIVNVVIESDPDDPRSGVTREQMEEYVEGQIGIGVIVSPAEKPQNTSLSGIALSEPNAGATGAVNVRTIGVDNKNIKITADETSKVATVSLADNISVQSVTVGDSLNGVKIDGATNKITNIADGMIARNSRDAVNGGQIYDLEQRLYKDISYVGAHAAAMAALAPLPYDPDNTTTVTAGFGNYRGKQSAAVGVYHYFSPRVMMNAGVSYNDGGDVMSKIGFSFAVGNGNDKKRLTPELYNDMKAKISEQDKVIAEQAEAINDLHTTIDEQNTKLSQQDTKLSQQDELIRTLNKRMSQLEKSLSQKKVSKKRK
ncbi:MAG: YadA-like family protein [Synergistes sp.]|nr:YadA-like family protein [Synergistes sp.]